MIASAVLTITTLTTQVIVEAAHNSDTTAPMRDVFIMVRFDCAYKQLTFAIQALASLLIYLCAHIVGVFTFVWGERVQRKTFRETKMSVVARLRMQRENAKQVSKMRARVLHGNI